MWGGVQLSRSCGAGREARWTSRTAEHSTRQQLLPPGKQLRLCMHHLPPPASSIHAQGRILSFFLSCITYPAPPPSSPASPLPAQTACTPGQPLASPVPRPTCSLPASNCGLMSSSSSPPGRSTSHTWQQGVVARAVLARHRSEDRCGSYAGVQGGGRAQRAGGQHRSHGSACAQPPGCATRPPCPLSPQAPRTASTRYAARPSTAPQNMPPTHVAHRVQHFCRADEGEVERDQVHLLAANVAQAQLPQVGALHHRHARVGAHALRHLAAAAEPGGDRAERSSAASIDGQAAHQAAANVQQGTDPPIPGRLCRPPLPALTCPYPTSTPTTRAAPCCSRQSVKPPVDRPESSAALPHTSMPQCCSAASSFSPARHTYFGCSAVMVTAAGSPTGVPALVTGLPLTRTLPAAVSHARLSAAVAEKQQAQQRQAPLEQLPGPTSTQRRRSRQPPTTKQRRTLDDPRLDDVAAVLGAQLQAHFVQPPLLAAYLRHHTGMQEGGGVCEGHREQNERACRRRRLPPLPPLDIPAAPAAVLRHCMPPLALLEHD